MMWERERSTPETESVAQDGTTFTSFLGNSACKATVELDLSSNRIQVLVLVGDYEYLSDWLAVSPLLGRPATAQIIRTALVLWHQRASWRYTKQPNGSTPMELITDLYQWIEPALA